MELINDHPANLIQPTVIQYPNGLQLKPETPKSKATGNLICNAIHCLQDSKGSTFEDIKKYISSTQQIGGDHLKLGLKNAIDRGLLMQLGGKYAVTEQGVRQNRRARKSSGRRRRRSGGKRKSGGRSRRGRGRSSGRKRSRSGKRRSRKRSGGRRTRRRKRSAKAAAPEEQ